MLIEGPKSANNISKSDKKNIYLDIPSEEMSSDRVACKEEDFLDNDQPIRGQNYACLSFISPEDVIVSKEVYFMHKFASLFSNDVKDMFVNLMEKFKGDQGIVDMFTNLQDRYDYLFDVKKLQDEFDFYKSTNAEKLEAEYLEKNNFQTTVRGIKIRGSYETLIEAQKRAEYLKKTDGKFDVYVAEVGCWCPWAPKPLEIQNQEYAETELNTLMKKYQENMEEKELFYKKRTEDLSKKAKDQKLQNTNDGASTSQEGVKASLVTEDDDPWLKNKLAEKPELTPVAEEVVETVEETNHTTVVVE